jgi:dienelactone hydrolase
MKPIAPLRSTVLAGALLASLLPLSAAEIQTLNTPRTFPPAADLVAWQNRATEIRAQIHASCGLWPLPEKTPLNARIFDRIERADYSIEKVVLETHPGVFLAGNLYRPVRQTPSRYPGILNPHGHWAEGRLVHSDTGSVPARCIQFAKMGMVAFAYDMVGYNDTAQFSPRKEDGSLEFPAFYDGHVRFAQDPTNELWGISLMGTQTWNSIRALDFLASLPDVDPTRLASTGASGGGTQTFMLGAIDPRLAAVAPMVMVSHSMQGGCWCENAPGLRVRFSNMEISAAAAPRPQLLVAATGDWTKTTMELEGPAIANIYQLFGPGGQFRYEIFDFPHNYNRTTREVAYAFMAEHLLNRSRAPNFPEQSFTVPPARDLRLWNNNHVPPGAKSAADYKAYLIEQTRAQLTTKWPQSAAGLKAFKDELGPVYRAVFQLARDPQEFDVKLGTSTRLDNGARVSTFEVTSQGGSHSIPVRIVSPRRSRSRTSVVLAHPLGMISSFDQAGRPIGFAEQLVTAGHTVIAFDAFLSGSRADNAERAKRIHIKDFFSTYNRTDLQERVGDLVTISAFARSHLPDHKIVLAGQEQAGLWAMLAAPAADAVLADAAQFDANNDALWVQQDWLTPAIRRIGTFDGPLLLAAPNPLLIHNAGTAFPTQTVAGTYQRLTMGAVARLHQERLPGPVLLNWIAGL